MAGCDESVTVIVVDWKLTEPGGKYVITADHGVAVCPDFSCIASVYVDGVEVLLPICADKNPILRTRFIRVADESFQLLHAVNG